MENMDDELNMVNKNDKHNHTNNELFINSDNVYLTYAGVVKLKGNIYAVSDDGSLRIDYDRLCKHIQLGDDVIINLNYKNYIIAVVIVKSLESKLEKAIEEEDYELAKTINDKIKNKQMENKNKMEDLTIKIVITNGEKEIKVSNINLGDYQKAKNLHGISLVDEIIEETVLTFREQM